MTTQQVFEYKTSNFQDHSGDQTLYRFCQQTLYITPCFLNAVKGAFNMLTHTVQQAVKFRRISVGLVSPLAGPNAITRLLSYLSLPVFTNKAFISKEVAILDPSQDDFSSE